MTLFCIFWDRDSLAYGWCVWADMVRMAEHELFGRFLKQKGNFWRHAHGGRKTKTKTKQNKVLSPHHIWARQNKAVGFAGTLHTWAGSGGGWLRQVDMLWGGGGGREGEKGEEQAFLPFLAMHGMHVTCGRHGMTFVACL